MVTWRLWPLSRSPCPPCWKTRSSRSVPCLMQCDHPVSCTHVRACALDCSCACAKHMLLLRLMHQPMTTPLDDGRALPQTMLEGGRVTLIPAGQEIGNVTVRWPPASCRHCNRSSCQARWRPARQRRLYCEPMAAAGRPDAPGPPTNCRQPRHPDCAAHPTL